MELEKQLEADFAALPHETKAGLMLMVKEYERACKKHPSWPTDYVHAGAVVSEEAGELVRATLNHTYEYGEYQEMLTEAIHTGATALRFIIHTMD